MIPIPVAIAIAVLAFLLPTMWKWVEASAAHRAEFRNLVIRIIVWVVLLGIIGNSIKGIADFGLSDASITRIGVLLLLLHCFNLVCYTKAVFIVLQIRAEKKAARLVEQA